MKVLDVFFHFSVLGVFSFFLNFQKQSLCLKMGRPKGFPNVKEKLSAEEAALRKTAGRVKTSKEARLREFEKRKLIRLVKKAAKLEQAIES